MSGIKAVAGMAAATLTLIFAAGSAQAVTYCVHQPAQTCPVGQTDVGADLQAALTAAQASGEADSIEILDGTYTGPFSYATLAPAGGLAVIGTGDEVILTAAADEGVGVINLSGVNPVSISHVEIEVPGGNLTLPNSGLTISGSGEPSRVVDDVSVTLPVAPGGPTFGISVHRGIVRNAFVNGPLPAVNPGGLQIGIGGSAGTVIEDSVSQSLMPVAMSGGGTIRRVDTIGGLGFWLSGAAGGGPVTIEDSLWRSITGSVTGTGLLAECGDPGVIQVTARNLTLVNETAQGNTVEAVCEHAGQSAGVDLRSTIAVGGAASLAAVGIAGTANIDVAYSNFTPAPTQSGAGSAVTQGPGNLNLAAPGFAGVLEFQLAPGSPMIDAGDPAGLAPGESTTDLERKPRITLQSKPASCPQEPPTGRRDIGAYESPEIPIPLNAVPCPPKQLRPCKKAKRKSKKRLAADAKKKKKKKKKCKKRKPKKKGKR
jgi:hypothetical protein